MSSRTRIQLCVDKHEEYVLTLAAMPDNKLREKLETIHLQMDLALQQKNTAALELLEVWRAQTIEARTYKAENNIADAEDEIAALVAQIETVVAEEPVVEEAEDVVYEPLKVKRSTQTTNDAGNSQLSFF